MIERLCIIGVGLIGGSLALALKKAGFCQTVIGIGRSAKNLELALEKKVIDVASHDFSAVKGADMVVLATPVGSTEKVCREIAGYLDESAVFTDVGSVKKAIVKQVESAFGKLPPILCLATRLQAMKTAEPGRRFMIFLQVAESYSRPLNRHQKMRSIRCGPCGKPRVH